VRRAVREVLEEARPEARRRAAALVERGDERAAERLEAVGARRARRRALVGALQRRRRRQHLAHGQHAKLRVVLREQRHYAVLKPWARPCAF
jgi:hypothetical protein